MSSYVSTISISDREWATLQRCVADTDIYVTRQRELAQRLREEAELREEELKQIREQTAKLVDSAVGMLQGSFHRAVSNLSNTAADTARKQNVSFEAELSNLREDIKATRARTAAVSAQVSGIAQEYSRVISQLVTQDRSAAVNAQAYLDNLNTMFEQIQQLNGDILAPAKFFEFQQIVQNANGNIRAGNFNSALITANTAILKGGRFLTELIVERENFGRMLSETLEKANIVKNRFDTLSPEMQGVISFEIAGEPVEFEYDIEHWSEGRFGRLRGEFQQVFDQLEPERAQSLSVKSLEVLRERLDDLERQLGLCDAGARQELLGSLNAQETAARLCDSLIDNNWELSEQGFEGGDDRNPFTMTYRDRAGNNISIIVAPGASAEKPNIFLEAFGEEPVHADIAKRNAHAALAAGGINIEQTKQMDDCRSNPDAATFVKNTLPRVKAMNQQRRQRNFETA